MRADYPMNQEKEMNDPINPNHYTERGKGIIECIDFADQMDFCRGNAFKYIWRAGDKGDLIEDLEKAQWYLERATMLEGPAVDAIDDTDLTMRVIHRAFEDEAERRLILIHIVEGSIGIALELVTRAIQDAK